MYFSPKTWLLTQLILVSWNWNKRCKRASVATLPNLPNWSWPMKESIHLIGGLFGYVFQHDLFKYVQISTCQMCDMKSSNGWTLMVLYIYTKIVKVSVLGKLVKSDKKYFGKPKLMQHTKPISKVLKEISNFNISFACCGLMEFLIQYTVPMAWNVFYSHSRRLFCFVIHCVIITHPAGTSIVLLYIVVFSIDSTPKEPPLLSKHCVFPMKSWAMYYRTIVAPAVWIENMQCITEQCSLLLCESMEIML